MQITIWQQQLKQRNIPLEFGGCLIFICLALALKFVFVSYFSLQCFVFNNSNSLFCCFSTKKYVVCVCVNNVKLATTCNTLKVFQEVLNENKQNLPFICYLLMVKKSCNIYLFIILSYCSDIINCIRDFVVLYNITQMYSFA